MQELLSTYKDIFKYNLRNIVDDARKLFLPREDITVSEWAAKNRYVTKEESARPGPWDNSIAPLGVEIMDAFTDPDVEKITMMFSAQIVKTEIMKNMIGYVIDHDPAPMMIVYPSEGDARQFSTEKLEPMLENNKCLKDKVAPAKSNSKYNTTLYKKFWGGFLSIAGGRVPQELARRSVKYVFADDRDRIGTAGDEGDAVALAFQRTESYELLGRKIILASTPTVDGESSIAAEYENSDQRRPYSPCPYCGELQIMEFEQLKWEKETDLYGQTIAHKTETVYYECFYCQAKIEQKHKEWMIDNTVWVAKYPERKKHRGYWANRLYSKLSSWQSIADLYLDSRKDPKKYQVFINTVLAKLWKRQEYEEIDQTGLVEKCEHYLTNDRPTIPNEILVITLAVDTQADRLEYQFTGWAKQNIPYVLVKDIIYGDPDQDDIWNDMDEISLKTFTRDDGVELKINYVPGIHFPVFVDSAGRNTQSVYKQCKKRYYKGWIALKGQGGENKPILLNRTKGGPNKDIPVQLVGVDAAKALIYKMIRNIKKENEWNRIHFTSAYCDQDYFTGLISEKPYKEIDNKGFTHIVWKKISGHIRNEPLDLMAYSFASIICLKPNYEKVEKNLLQQKESVEKATDEKPAKPVPLKQNVMPQRMRPNIGGRYVVNGWRK